MFPSVCWIEHIRAKFTVVKVKHFKQLSSMKILKYSKVDSAILLIPLKYKKHTGRNRVVQFTYQLPLSFRKRVIVCYILRISDDDDDVRNSLATIINTQKINLSQPNKN